MNLSDIANIFQILEAIAVVATLVFVGLQIRDSNRIAQGNAYQDVFHAANSFFSILMQDKELARIYWTGRENPTKLNESERSRFFYACVQWFCFYENLYLQYSSRLIPKVNFDAWSRAFRDDLRDPGFRAYWEHESHDYDEGFQAYVNAVLKQIETKETLPKTNSEFLNAFNHTVREEGV